MASPAAEAYSGEGGEFLLRRSVVLVSTTQYAVAYCSIPIVLLVFFFYMLPIIYIYGADDA